MPLLPSCGVDACPSTATPHIDYVPQSCGLLPGRCLRLHRCLTAACLPPLSSCTLQAREAGQEVEKKKPVVVKYGINHITQLVESGKAQCVGELGCCTLLAAALMSGALPAQNGCISRAAAVVWLNCAVERSQRWVQHSTQSAVHAALGSTATRHVTFGPGQL